MNKGDLFPVTIEGIVVGQATVVAYDGKEVELEVPGMRVIMSVNTSLSTAPTASERAVPTTERLIIGITADGTQIARAGDEFFYGDERVSEDLANRLVSLSPNVLPPTAPVEPVVEPGVIKPDEAAGTNTQPGITSNTTTEVKDNGIIDDVKVPENSNE